MRRIFSLVAVGLLAACSAPVSVPIGETVSIQKLLSDTRGRPYECVNYDARTDSCEGIAKRQVRGDRIFYDVSMLVPGPNADTIKVKIGASFKIEGGRYCGNLSRADIRTEGRLPPAQRSLLEELFLAEMISMGDVCGLYVQDASGSYTSVTTDRQGRVLRDGVEPVEFFRGPKKLRLAI